ncbi:MAG: rhomboid family intramembrane serine protease [Prevotella sp.]|nr:rhomboid family intramembrane serine protease [Prevotella sp.]MCM1437410.1 rhomboid family intramembrane serine protease [Prevotella sp.]
MKRNKILLAIVAVNVVVFILCILTGFMAQRGWIGFMFASTLSLPSSFTALAHHFWSPLTYMVTHTDVFHILFNMLWLWWFGEVLATTQTNSRIFWIYLLSGLSGALFFVLSPLTPQGASLIGSSAAVLGMMSAAAFISPDVEFRIFLVGNVKLKWLALICVVLAFFGIGGGNSGGVSAHLGGVVFGLGYGLFYRYLPLIKGRLLRNREKKKRFSVIEEMRARQAFKPTKKDSERLDELLDKIRLSGFESLSDKERNELKFLSRRLGGKTHKS